MQVTVELLFDRCHNLGVAVSVVGGADATNEVEELSAVDVPDTSTLSSFDKERFAVHALCNPLVTFSGEPVGVWSWVVTHWCICHVLASTAMSTDNTP